MKYVIWIVILVVLLGGGAWWWTVRAAEAAKENAASAAPQTAKVVRKDLKMIVQSQGSVASNRDVDIKCKASGNIIQLPYKDVSADVKPGALLLQLDSNDEDRLLSSAKAVVDSDEAKLREAQLTLQIAQMNLDTTRQRDEADLASAQAKLSDAQAKARRTQELFDSKLASKEDLETAQTTASLAEAEVSTAQAAILELDQQKLALESKQQEIKQMDAALRQDQSKVDTAQQNVDYCTVTAPLPDDESQWWQFSFYDPPQWRISVMTAGVAIGYLVQSGSSGSSGGTTVMTLSDLSHIFVIATVAESDTGVLLERFNKHQDLPVTITADAYKNVQFQGKVVRIATQGKTVTNVTTFDVKIEVTSRNFKLLQPNMTANVEITTDARTDVLTIPAAAVTTHKHEAKQSGTQPTGTQTDGAVAVATTENGGKRPGGRKKNGGAGGGNGGGGSGMGSQNDPMDATVTVLNADGSLGTKEIVVGLSDGIDTEVISGLAEGDTIVLTKGGGDSKWKGGGDQGPGVRGMMRGFGGGGR